jgi:hypothetical protein
VSLNSLSGHKAPRPPKSSKPAVPGSCSCPNTHPGLNPIEMAFSKLKARLRKAAARTFEALWEALGSMRTLHSDEARWNFFKAAGYTSD